MASFRLCCLVCFAVLLYVSPVENVAIHRRARVDPLFDAPSAALQKGSNVTAAFGRGSFFRGAVESIPDHFTEGRLPLRDAVAYRPSLEEALTLASPYNRGLRYRVPPAKKPFTRLSIFSASLFASQFWMPSLEFDYYRRVFYPQVPNLARRPVPTYSDVLRSPFDDINKQGDLFD